MCASMSNLCSYELTHPELLSEHQLREMLRNTHINVQSFEKLHKSKLVEIYKRVAMPLPQRQHGRTKNLNTEAEFEALEKILAVKDNDASYLTTNADKGNKRMSQTSHSQTDKLKSPLNDQKSLSKKIRLCPTPKIEIVCNGTDKRRCDEQNEESLTRKRQKITWP